MRRGQRIHFDPTIRRTDILVSIKRYCEDRQLKFYFIFLSSVVHKFTVYMWPTLCRLLDTCFSERSDTVVGSPVFFLTLIERAAHTRRDSSLQGAICNAASVHFGPTIRMTNIPVSVSSTTNHMYVNTWYLLLNCCNS